MAVPTDEELQEIEERNSKLREQITAAQQKKAETLAEQDRAVRGAQLMAEQARLEAELARATEDAKVGNVRGGSEALLGQLVEQVQTAEALAEAPVGPVDTNAKNQPKGTTGETVAVPEEKKNGGSN